MSIDKLRDQTVLQLNNIQNQIQKLVNDLQQGQARLRSLQDDAIKLTGAIEALDLVIKQDKETAASQLAGPTAEPAQS